MRSGRSQESTEAVTVVGTGRMASGIALAAASAGHRVTVAGRSSQAAARVAALVSGAAGADVAHGAIDETTLAAAGVVIETIAEVESDKLEVLGQVSRSVPPSALLATNTSSLSLSALADAVEIPGRFIGMHFLNPADQTVVVEVVGGELSTVEAVDAGCAFVESLGKHPIKVRRDVKGYIWNRLQFAMLRECLHLLESGVADAADIDLAVSAGLAPRWMAAGPLATADLGGLQTFALICQELFPALDARTEGSQLLGARASEGGSLRGWDEVQTAHAIALRTEALAFAAQLHGVESD